MAGEKKEPTMDDVVSALQIIYDGMQKLGARVDALSAPPGDGKDKGGDKDDPGNKPDPTMPNFDDMSRGEMIDYLLKTMGKAEKHIMDRIEKVETRGVQADLREQIEEARDTYDDFDEWAPDIREVMKNQPTLSIDEAYALSRHRNPDKVESINNKREEERIEQEKKEPPKFGGLMPTSGLVSNSDSMDPAAAADAAWNETMGHRSDIQ